MSTHISVSTILESPLETSWKVLRDFTWPSRVLSGIDAVKMLEDSSPFAVGSMREMTWTKGPGAVQVSRRHRLLELSDVVHLNMKQSHPPKHFRAIWELLPNEDAADDVVSPVSAVQVTLQLKRISDTGATFMEWITQYSADVTPTFLREEEEDLKTNVKEIKAFFSKQ